MGSIDDNDDYNDRDHIMSEEDELVRKINKWLKECRTHSSSWREEARSCYDYFAGHQWDEQDVAKLNEEDRPVITFNRIFRTINGITGLENQNRQEIKFEPAEEDDGGKSEVWNATLKYVRSNCDAEDEESEMFQDTSICGMGWTETRVDYDTNLDGEILEDRIDPLMMLWDKNARKRNLADRRWQAQYKEFTKDEFKELWPDIEPQCGSFWPEESVDPIDGSLEARDYGNDESDKLRNDKCIGVFQVQWWEREQVYRAVDAEGKVMGFTEEKYSKVKDFIESNARKVINQPRRVYKQAFINGKQILEYGKCPIQRFTFNCTTGFRDRNNNLWFGIVSPMKDPQMWANKWLSQILHIVNSNAKGGLMLEEGAAKDIRKIQDEWSKPNSISIFNPGALAQGRVQQKESPRYPEGVDRLLNMAMQSISDVTGVNLEMLGVANRDQPAALELSRKEAGVTIIAPLFDGLRRYRKEQGRILSEFIQTYITDKRKIRIAGDRRAQFVELIKDHGSLKYDVIIDESPKSPNMQERVFSILSNMLPTLLQSGIPIPPDILDYAPIPETLKTKWKEMMSDPERSKHSQEMQEITTRMAQLEAAKKEKEVGETESKTVLNLAKAKESAAISEDEAAQAANKLGLANAEQANKNRQVENDIALRDREMMINEKRKELQFLLDQQRIEQEHEMKLEHSRQLHNHKLQQSREPKDDR